MSLFNSSIRIVLPLSFVLSLFICFGAFAQEEQDSNTKRKMTLMEAYEKLGNPSPQWPKDISKEDEQALKIIRENQKDVVEDLTEFYSKGEQRTQLKRVLQKKKGNFSVSGIIFKALSRENQLKVYRAAVSTYKIGSEENKAFLGLAQIAETEDLSRIKKEIATRPNSPRSAEMAFNLTRRPHGQIFLFQIRDDVPGEWQNQRTVQELFQSGMEGVWKNIKKRLLKPYAPSKSYWSDAIMAIEVMEKPEYNPILISALFNYDHKTLLRSLMALEKLGGKPSLTALRIWHDYAERKNENWLNQEIENQYKETLEGIKKRSNEGKKGVIEFDQLISKDDATVKKTIKSISEQKNDAAISPVMIPFLYHQDRSIRLATLSTLKKIGNRPTKLSLQLWHRHEKKEDENRDKKWLDEETEQLYQKTIQAIEKRMNENKSSDEK